MAQVVFDASAVVAILKNETGADFVANFIGKALVSTVNLQQVIKVLLITGTTLLEITAMIDDLNLNICPHTIDDAYAAASLFQATKIYGYGLVTEPVWLWRSSRKYLL